MNIFEFVPYMKSLDNTFATVSVVVVAVFLVLMIFRLLGGMSRGFYRQLVRLGFNLGAVVIAFIGAKAIEKNIVGSLDINNILSFIPNIGGDVGEELTGTVTEMLSSVPTNAIEKILLLPAAIIIVPAIFVGIYFAAKAVLSIVCSIVCKVCNVKKKPDCNSEKLGGAVLSGIEGIIFFIVIFIPFTSAINMLDKCYQDALTDEDTTISAEAIIDYQEKIVPISKNPAFSFVSKLGGNALASSFATVEIDGKKAPIDEEIQPILKFIMIDSAGTDKIDWNNLTESNKATLTQLIDSVGNSNYLSNLFVTLLKSSTELIEGILTKVEDDGFGDASGSELEEGREMANQFIDSLMQFIKSFEADTFKEDLATLRELYFALSDSGVLRAFKEQDVDFIEVISGTTEDGGTIIGNVKDILQSNPRTTPIVKMLTSLLLKGLTDSSDVEISYDDLKEDMNQILDVKKDNYADEDDYMKALSDSLNSTLRQHGVTLDSDVIDEVASYVDENFSQLTEFTEADFNDLILQYYDIYLEYLESNN